MSIEEKCATGPMTTVGPVPLRTLTLRDKKWYYKCEGNANVVLAVPDDGTVVRVMKGGETTTAEAARTLSVRTDFCDAVRRLFFADCDFVDVPVPMLVSTDELCEIDKRILRLRPADRRHKGLGWTGGLVAVCPDYTASPFGTAAFPWPVFCVEIKPKQGWLHEADVLATVERRGRAMCAFCSHQYLKLRRADVQEMSWYCPLDLFSGRRERVERAIRNLIRTPQNNLKVFVDGKPVNEFCAEEECRQAFLDVDRCVRFVAAALLGDFDDRQQNETAETEQRVSPVKTITENYWEKPPCDFDAISMPRHCVLHKVLSMQKMQNTGFAAVCSEYERLPKDGAQFGHVDRLRSVAAVANEQIVLDPVDGYLVATTARDCSVFVTFCRMKGECVDRHVVRFGNFCYTVRVKVSDLDPKPLSTVSKHQKRNADVLLTCKHYLARTLL